MQRRAVVDGVMRSLGTGFVFTSHDLPTDLVDAAYEMLATFFALPAATKERWCVPDSHGQTGYTGLLVETAAISDMPDWKEMLNWGEEVPGHHPLRARYPHRYRDPVLPEADVPGIGKVLREFHTLLVELQTRFLRVIAVGLGVAEQYFDDLLADGSHLTRAVHYPAMVERADHRSRLGRRARRHQPRHRTATRRAARDCSSRPRTDGSTSRRRPTMSS